MTKFECPHCKQLTVTPMQKFLAGKWIDVYCTACGGRSCMYPVLLSVVYFFYIWDVMLFGYVAVAKQSLFYLGVLIFFWVILESISLWIPLARMKPRAT